MGILGDGVKILLEREIPTLSRESGCYNRALIPVAKIYAGKSLTPTEITDLRILLEKIQGTQIFYEEILERTKRSIETCVLEVTAEGKDDRLHSKILTRTEQYLVIEKPVGQTEQTILEVFRRTLDLLVNEKRESPKELQLTMDFLGFALHQSCEDFDRAVEGLNEVY
ncbi:MAG: hypothetical protein AABX30_03455 [Nanoarchaeota archaeon]